MEKGSTKPEEQSRGAKTPHNVRLFCYSHGIYRRRNLSTVYALQQDARRRDSARLFVTERMCLIFLQDISGTQVLGLKPSVQWLFNTELHLRTREYSTQCIEAHAAYH